MLSDKTQLERTAQLLVVDYQQSTGSPPAYSGTWLPVWQAKVERVEINSGTKPSVAKFYFPSLRWDADCGLRYGDRIRIRTDNPDLTKQTTVFSGFVVGDEPSFFGGSDRSKAYERLDIVCMDHRWLLASTSPMYGMIIRTRDDYQFYGHSTQTPVDGSYTWLSGRRAIFNADGKGNRDPEDLIVNDSSDNKLCDMPIFSAPAGAEYWTARQMISYILSPLNNKAYHYFTIDDPSEIKGLDHDDFDTELSHILIDSLNPIESIEVICRNLGFSFREDYDTDGKASLVFYKINSATAYARDDDNPTIKHHLHAPAFHEEVSLAVIRGRKLIWQMDLAGSICSIVNSPCGLGSPHKFEITAELVPAWPDTDLTPDDSESYANLFFTEAQLQEMTDKNSKDYYKYYHASGSDFKRDVGRKWALNESGTYSTAAYDRGDPIDFADYIDNEYIIDASGKRLYAPFNRQLLPLLTFDKDTLNPLDIKVEFSFDSGTTWQVIECAVSSLPSEAGIYITEPNLAEIVDPTESTISGGDLDGVQLNLWTSLCDDKVNSRVFKNDTWHTRIRVTATIQMDQRLAQLARPTISSGSPFYQRKIYNFTDKYQLTKRTESSSYSDTDLPAWNCNQTNKLKLHLESIRSANEDMSISGMFTLDRLWLGDDTGQPDFALGDLVERISGREFSLSASFAGRKVFPEIIQLIYAPDEQKTQILIRDLRFAEVQL